MLLLVAKDNDVHTRAGFQSFRRQLYKPIMYLTCQPSRSVDIRRWLPTEP